ncbi:MAG: hypothetical protein AB8B50_07155 [Pirellulaceae bacterium]
MLCSLTLALGLISGNSLQAQDAAASGSQTKVDTKAKVYVAFRMQNWTSKHINQAEAAKKHADTLTQLGCEVKVASHNGHTDVTCRTTYWKSLALDGHDQAHQWVTWLQQSGFETIHGHPQGEHKTDGKQHAEMVQYRLADWKSRHIHDNNELAQLLALYRGLGCEVTTSGHDGHTDVKARCPEWMEIQIKSHDAANAWQKFLRDMGFEAKHEH